MLLEAPMVVRAFGAHHALVIDVNSIAVSFIAIEASGLRIQRLSLNAFKALYRPFSKYSPKEMAVRLLEFGKLHGITSKTKQWLTAFVDGEPSMSDDEKFEGADGAGEQPSEKRKTVRKAALLYKHLRDPINGEKLAPQSQLILATIKDGGEGGINRGDLIMKLSSLLTTKQPPERVLAFYQPKLVESGLISVTK